MSEDDLRTLILDFRESVTHGFDRIDGRLDGIDGRMDVMDGRLDGIDRRLDGVDGSLTRLEKQALDFQDEVRDRFRTMEAGFFNTRKQMHDGHEARIIRLEDAS